MRITLLVASLGGGGAERAVTSLAEAFNLRGYAVTVVTWNSEEPDFYSLPPNIARKRVPLDNSTFFRWYNILGHLRRTYKLRSSIKETKPDVVVSFLDGTNELFLLSSIGQRYVKMISCQVDIREHKHYNLRWNAIRNMLYGLADRVVFLDGHQAKRASNIHPLWKCTGIPNPLPIIDISIPKDAEAVLVNTKKHPRNIVAMGRLTYQKGFDLLLEAFSPLAAQFPDWGLVILGEGPDRQKLEAQAEASGLDGRVFMPGRISNPHGIIAKCDVFAFSSRYEGQGLALAEAMACGIPVVSFNCPSGPSEIIVDQVDGILVPAQDVVSFGDALTVLMENEEKRETMGQKALAIADRLSTQGIVDSWDNLIRNSLMKKRNVPD